VAGLLAAITAFAVVTGACGSKSSNGATFPGGKDGGGKYGDGGTTGSFGEGGFSGPTDASFGNPDVTYGADAFFAMDPPLMFCPADAGDYDGAVPGGTPQCPSDKNREGCPCPTPGVTAACWPGLRANRNLGQCKDGTTTCIEQGENTEAVWGPCMGYVLPSPGATTGAAACKCFSSGQWDIMNLSPCFITDSTGADWALSSTLTSGMVNCPMESSNGPYPAPSADWSSDTLKVDCAGNFTLCYTIKAGNAKMPMATDCTVGQVCTMGFYSMKNVVQDFPDLPGWAGTDQACAEQFVTGGGYGQMTVQGESITCDVIDNGMGQPLVFATITYCPVMNPPPGCTSGGSGTFQ
jgi:hypothetical protein